MACHRSNLSYDRVWAVDLNQVRDFEVLESGYKVGKTGAALITNGVGPCLSVALIYAGKGYLFHGPLPQHATTFGVFARRLSREIPKHARSVLKVVLAGGHGTTRSELKEIDNAKRFCTSELQLQGFFALHNHWGRSEFQYQNVQVSPASMIVEIENCTFAEEGQLHSVRTRVDMS